MRGFMTFSKICAAATLLALLSHRAAAADILEIDCNSGIPGADMIHIWIDMQKSFVTIQQNMPVGLTGYHGSYRIEITPTSFDWGMSTLDDTTVASVDRTTGQLHLIRYGSNPINAAYPCTKGSAPFPATKF